VTIPVGAALAVTRKAPGAGVAMRDLQVESTLSRLRHTTDLAKQKSLVTVTEPTPAARVARHRSIENDASCIQLLQVGKSYASADEKLIVLHVVVQLHTILHILKIEDICADGN
jgi:hypothetical protein